MTGRERLLIALSGGTPDRVPVSFFVQEAFLSYLFRDRKTINRVNEAVEAANLLGFDVMTRQNLQFAHAFLKGFSLRWQVEEKELIDERGLNIKTTIQTPEGILTQEKIIPHSCSGFEGTDPVLIKGLIEGEKDLDLFIKYWQAPSSETARKIKWEEERAKEVIGDSGISVPWCAGGVFTIAAENLRNIKDLLMDPYINFSFYEKFMECLVKILVKYNSVLVEAKPDLIGMGGYTANAELVGKKYFDRYVLPYERKLIVAMRDMGARILYHNCGKANALLDSYPELGIDALETLAPPPRGDVNIANAKKRVGDRIALVGNIDQVDFLKQASFGELETKAKEIIDNAAGGGGFVFAGSDWLEPGTPIENIKKVVEVVKDYGKY